MQARALDVLSAWTDELAGALAPRLGDDAEAARVVAMSVLHLLNEAVLAWTDEGAERGALPDMVDRLGAALLPANGSRAAGS
jgi:hypothetical protein